MNLAPDYIEPVVGWRIWAVSESEGRLRLRSLVYNETWLPEQPFVAECHRRPNLLRHLWRRSATAHAPPEWSCDCGIYATRDVEHAVRYSKTYGDRPMRVLHRVIGRVSLWGSVLEYTDGWRASRAYPQELFIPRVGPAHSPGADAIAAGLADYGVPVEIVEGMGAERFGQPLEPLPAWPPV